MNRSSKTLGRRREGGYAILLVIFLATLMLIMAMAAAPNILTEGRRQKEELMIWRGNQYVRGIKLYYRKMGRFPTSLDDLTKPQMGDIRFMRQAYKDPMNTVDGSWRLIYVGPAGQLIGSLRPHQTLQIPGMKATQLGTPASMLASGQNSSTNPTNQQQSAGGQAGTEPSGTPQSGTGQTAEGTSQAGQGNSSGSSVGNSDQTSNSGNGPADMGQNDNSASISSDDFSSDTPTIMGGNIIGVGSKVNHPSVMVYEKAKNYRQFEFIWDPSKDPITLGGSVSSFGTPAGTLGTPQGTPASGFGTPQGMGPMNPTPTGSPTTQPPATGQNPPQP
jgi:hypothetical protein